MKQAIVQKLIALFCLGWLLLSFPLITLWDQPGTLFGLPLLPAGLFVVWGTLIGVLVWIMERDSG
ncbi:MAG: hypothetical protein ACXIUM_04315 [Wenzhouxiangella sp.]